MSTTTENIQLIPENFDLDTTRFELRKLPITNEFIDSIVSTIYLAENFNSIAGKILTPQTLTFLGTYPRQIGQFMEQNNILTSRFNFEFLVNPVESIQIITDTTEFLYDPVTRQSKQDPDGILYKYFFLINFVN